MFRVSRITAAALAACAFLRPCLAQTAGTYEDPDTGVTYTTWSYTTPSDYTFGMVLPEDALTTDATEYIGILQCSIDSGWCGMSHGQSGQMPNALLLMAWPYEDQVLTSFRFSTGYTTPDVYTGDAVLTQISSKVTDTMFEVQYRCENCFSWDQDGTTGSVSTSDAFLVLGWAAATEAPGEPQCPTGITFIQHDNGFGQYGASLDDVPSSSYEEWAALATNTVPGECDGDGGGSPETPTCTADVIDQTYDYVVVGAGAGGITVADKLSEAGNSVLLIEKGPPSTGIWGGTMKPDWLVGTDLTRFDVPGLCNQIWVDSAGIACTDTDQMAGCVLGGGTAVNAGLWIKPPPEDWNENFPEGWHMNDLQEATNRVFNRIPGTIRPSTDGQLYLRQGRDILANALSEGGWSYVEDPNSVYGNRNQTVGSTNYMFAGGERGGPLATYLVSASKRDNFVLSQNISARRAIRDGSKISGVELDCTIGNTTELGVVSAGRVVVSAGTFGSAKFLMRSGIGPADQLDIVASSDDGPNMIDESQWIELPVGENLVDHTNTDTFITHPDVVFYDFYEAWDDPIESDENKYLNNRAGILAQAAPNIGPMFWDQIVGDDGITRQVQYTARVEGNETTGTTHTMIMSQYLGRGSTSRGKMAITKSLGTVVAEHPYLRNEHDIAAVVKGIQNVLDAISGYPDLTIAVPSANQTVQEYVDSLTVSPAARRSNHWLGTAKIGTDSGLEGGTAVVDLNTKVYGTDNLFVVDGSIFPGMSTGNPSAMIVIAAENAAARILALS